MTIKKTEELTLSLICMAGAAYLFGYSYTMPHYTYFSIGPLLFPRIILGAIFVLSTCLAWHNVDFTGRSKPAAPAKPDPAKRQGSILRAGVIILLLVYLVVLPYAGYRAATMVFLFVNMAFLGPRTKKMLGLYAVIAVITTLSMQYLFGTVLKLFLP